MSRRPLAIICALLLGASLGACATVGLPRPAAHRDDDDDTLRLQHMRLWTNGGYPLWLEVRAPRKREGSEHNVTLVFTTTISTRPRLEGCNAASLGGEHGRVDISRIRYARTAMELESDAPSLNYHYHESGIVEDLYVSLSVAALHALTGGEHLTGNLCELAIRFDAHQLRQIRQLATEAQSTSRAANARASTMLSSMEQ